MPCQVRFDGNSTPHLVVKEFGQRSHTNVSALSCMDTDSTTETVGGSLCRFLCKLLSPHRLILKRKTVQELASVHFAFKNVDRRRRGSNDPPRAARAHEDPYSKNYWFLCTAYANSVVIVRRGNNRTCPSPNACAEQTSSFSCVLL